MCLIYARLCPARTACLAELRPANGLNWSSDASELSLHSGALETIMGQYFSSSPEGSLPYGYAVTEQFGTDNSKQLFDCSDLFRQLEGQAILVAPQTDGAWNTDSLGLLIDELKDEYNAAEVTAAGFSAGAAESYRLGAAGKADRIAPIADPSQTELTDVEIEALKNVSAWIFSGYTDAEANITTARSNVNRLQSEGVDAVYTEYPFADHSSVRRNAVSDSALAEWIQSGAKPQRVVDLVLFSGQSNMAGRGDFADATICTPFEGYEYHSVKTPLAGGPALASILPALSTVNDPFGKYEDSAVMNDKSGSTYDRRNGDMVSSVMKSYYDKSGVPIVGVQASRGGETTSYFMSDSIMSEIATRYKDAEEYLSSAGYTVRRKFMVWCQGCSDADEIIAGTRTLDTYRSNVEQIFDKIMDAAGISDIFVVRIGHRNNNNSADAVYKQVNEAQAEIIDAADNVHEAGNLYTDAYKKLMRDNFHYYQPAYNSIGAAVGGNIAQYYIENVPEPTESPTPAPTDEPSLAVSASCEIDASGNLKITASLNKEASGRLIAVRYSKDGRVSDIQSQITETGKRDYGFTMTNDGTSTIELLLWSNDMISPLADAVTVKEAP